MKKFISLLLISAVLLASFVTANAEEVSYDVPQIKINTVDGNGKSLEKADGYVNADISIVDTDGSTLDGSVTVKVRGHSTALVGIPKKAFTFKFSKKQNVLGLGKGKKWALLANLYDPTLMRNFISFDLAQKLGLDYTSNFKLVELWLDGELRGSYLLIEPVQEGSDRVDIDIDSNGKDFLLELEAYREDSDVTYFKIDKMRFGISEPEEPDDEELTYIKSTMADAIAAVKSGDRAKIAEKLDLNSFELFYIFNEYVKPPDFDFSSVFFYFKDGKLYAGPPWDYDISLGNSNKDFSSVSPLTSETDTNYANKCNFYTYLCKQDWFMRESAKLFGDNLKSFTEIYTDEGMIDTFLDDYKDVINRNFTIWPVWRYWVNVQRRPLISYKENVDLLRDWSKERLGYLADYLGGYTATDDEAGFFKLGDVNMDTEVNIKDATKIQKLLANMTTLSDHEYGLADFNGDKKINIKDATALRKALVNP